MPIGHGTKMMMIKLYSLTKSVLLVRALHNLNVQWRGHLLHMPSKV
jgi:hypothetical protein